MKTHPPLVTRVGHLIACAAVLCCVVALPARAQPASDEPAQPSLVERVEALPQEGRVPDTLIEETAVLVLHTARATITDGLDASEDSLNKLIELHRLLGQQNDPRAQLLALRMAVVVDYIVMNEFYRRWLVHIKHPHTPPFDPAGYSIEIAAKLLKRNEMTDLPARADAALKEAGLISKKLTEAKLDGQTLLRDGLPHTMPMEIETRIRFSVLTPVMPEVDLKELHLGDLNLAAVIECHRTQWRVRLLASVLNQPSAQLPVSTEAAWKVLEQQMPVKRRDILSGSPVRPHQLGSYIAKYTGVDAEDFHHMLSLLLVPFITDQAKAPPLESEKYQNAYKARRWGAIVKLR